MLKIV
jgi:2-polyprenyl-6-methoxyphenol hydroxylase-like FAD-dependent oxidoreductase